MHEASGLWEARQGGGPFKNMQSRQGGKAPPKLNTRRGEGQWTDQQQIPLEGEWGSAQAAEDLSKSHIMLSLGALCGPVKTECIWFSW